MQFSVTHFNTIQKIPEEILMFLHQHSAVNFEAISILEQLGENPQAFEGILECISVSKQDKIQLVTCRIKPYNLLISHTMNIESIIPLVEYFKKAGISIPGIYGPAEEVKNFTETWEKLYEEEFSTSDEFLQYSLKQKKIIPQLLGEISIAKSEQTELLKGWTEKSIREIIPGSTEDFISSCTDSFLKLLEKHKVFILEIENDPVSMAALSGQTKTMQAIIDVYTPPEYRGKGYATELCLFLSEYILEDCKSTPILWVKSTNYTAIHVYEKIGFEKVAEMILSLKEN